MRGQSPQTHVCTGAWYHMNHLESYLCLLVSLVCCVAFYLFIFYEVHGWFDLIQWLTFCWTSGWQGGPLFKEHRSPVILVVQTSSQMATFNKRLRNWKQCNIREPLPFRRSVLTHVKMLLCVPSMRTCSTYYYIESTPSKSMDSETCVEDLVHFPL